MIAYVRMQLLRWLRRTLGIGLLVAAVFLPTLMAALWIAFGGMGPAEEPRKLFVMVVVVCVLAASGISIVNQLSSLVEEEARLKRSALLRVGDLDGFRAVGAYSLLGLVLAFLHGTMGYVGPAVVALFGGIPPGTWLAPSARLRPPPLGVRPARDPGRVPPSEGPRAARPELRGADRGHRPRDQTSLSPPGRSPRGSSPASSSCTSSSSPVAASSGVRRARPCGDACTPSHSASPSRKSCAPSGAGRRSGRSSASRRSSSDPPRSSSAHVGARRRRACPSLHCGHFPGSVVVWEAVILWILALPGGNAHRPPGARRRVVDPPRADAEPDEPASGRASSSASPSRLLAVHGILSLPILAFTPLVRRTHAEVALSSWASSSTRRPSSRRGWSSRSSGSGRRASLSSPTSSGGPFRRATALPLLAATTPDLLGYAPGVSGRSVRSSSPFSSAGPLPRSCSPTLGAASRSSSPCSCSRPSLVALRSCGAER